MNSKSNVIVTVVTVTYNAEKEVEMTLRSVTSQTYSKIQYIIIDGKSSDNTISIINKYLSLIDTLIVDPDLGIYDAMNKSLRIANGDFIIFMNAGDIFCSPDVIERFVYGISRFDDIYFGDFIFRDPIKNEDNLINFSFSKLNIAKTNICHQAIFYPKLYYKANSYNLKYLILADWLYNWEAIYTGFSFKYLNFPIVIYDCTGVSSKFTDEAFKRDRYKLIIKNLGIFIFIKLMFSKCNLPRLKKFLNSFKMIF